MLRSHASSLDAYQARYASFPTLTQEETAALVRLFRSGDESSRTFLLNCHMQLVCQAVRNHLGGEVSVESLLAVGQSALENALERYQAERHGGFTGFAAYRVCQAISRAVR